MFDDALREAAKLDEEFAKTKKLRGPLHGVPVSFKDQCEFFFCLVSVKMDDINQ